MSEVTSKSALPRTDLLAIDRTLLANERTFLAYFRTAIAFLTSGLAILNIGFFHPIRYVSWLLIVLSPLVLGFGVWRLLSVRRGIKKYRDE